MGHHAGVDGDRLCIAGTLCRASRVRWFRFLAAAALRPRVGPSGGARTWRGRFVPIGLFDGRLIRRGSRLGRGRRWGVIGDGGAFFFSCHRYEPLLI
jgi:hypothetical protein